MRAHFGDLIFEYFLQNQSHVTLYYHQASHDLRRFIQNWHHDWLIEERALANELMIGKLLPTEVSSASYQVRILVLLGRNSVTSRDLPISFPIDKDDLKLSLLMAVFQVAKTWIILTLDQSEVNIKASI